MVRRLGIAREAGDPLALTVRQTGWEPVPLFLTSIVPTGAPLPVATPDGIIILSPAGARLSHLPEGVPCLVNGEGTARNLTGRPVLVSPEPRAEGIWELLRERFPEGGDFLLVRGERSRGHLEQSARGSTWRLHPWITHAERPLPQLQELPALEAVLAMSPLQAELLGPRASRILRLAWGSRTADAFQATGFPSHAACDPKPEALERMLKRIA